jgi:hypothetical protein
MRWSFADLPIIGSEPVVVRRDAGYRAYGHQIAVVAGMPIVRWGNWARNDRAPPRPNLAGFDTLRQGGHRRSGSGLTAPRYQWLAKDQNWPSSSDA